MVVNVLVQFRVILVRNDIFIYRKQNIKFGYRFLLCNKYHVYKLLKKNDKKLTHFGDGL